jgi:hypothetical protein
MWAHYRLVREVLLLKKEQMKHLNCAKITMFFWKMRCQRKRMMLRRPVALMGASLIAIFVWIWLQTLLLLAVVTCFVGHASTSGCMFIQMRKNAQFARER